MPNIMDISSLFSRGCAGACIRSREKWQRIILASPREWREWGAEKNVAPTAYSDGWALWENELAFFVEAKKGDAG